ncbi:MAG: class I SAM-dependent methyltransferase [Candidatus Omnitrophica bacterium]|nr:class I SAM-dependent methyltransferase [Candidatus Omnitrophota bacterium]
METDVIENHKRYLARKELFKNFGCDIDQEREFVLAQAQPLTGSILEAGTGKGHFSLTLAKAGYKFTTIDISSEEQGFAKLNLKYYGLDGNVDFSIENGKHLSFKNDSFDVIFSVNTIYHFSNPYVVIDELIRVLAAKGKLILSDFTPEGFKLIEEIHASEGKVHEEGGASLEQVKTYLVRKEFRVRDSAS